MFLGLGFKGLGVEGGPTGACTQELGIWGSGMTHNRSTGRFWGNMIMEYLCKTRIMVGEVRRNPGLDVSLTRKRLLRETGKQLRGRGGFGFRDLIRV